MGHYDIIAAFVKWVLGSLIYLPEEDFTSLISGPEPIQPPLTHLYRVKAWACLDKWANMKDWSCHHPGAEANKRSDPSLLHGSTLVFSWCLRAWFGTTPTLQPKRVSCWCCLQIYLEKSIWKRKIIYFFQPLLVPALNLLHFNWFLQPWISYIYNSSSIPWISCISSGFSRPKFSSSSLNPLDLKLLPLLCFPQPCLSCILPGFSRPKILDLLWLF